MRRGGLLHVVRHAPVFRASISWLFFWTLTRQTRAKRSEKQAVLDTPFKRPHFRMMPQFVLDGHPSSQGAESFLSLSSRICDQALCFPFPSRRRGNLRQHPLGYVQAR